MTSVIAFRGTGYSECSLGSVRHHYWSLDKSCTVLPRGLPSGLPVSRQHLTWTWLSSTVLPVLASLLCGSLRVDVWPCSLPLKSVAFPSSALLGVCAVQLYSGVVLFWRLLLVLHGGHVRHVVHKVMCAERSFVAGQWYAFWLLKVCLLTWNITMWRHCSKWSKVFGATPFWFLELEFVFSKIFYFIFIVCDLRCKYM